MDLKECIKSIAKNINALGANVTTEEATKNAFVMPFLQALGFNVFNPLEVIPEFTADLGIKKGEKIDYAILKDGEPIFFVECKKIGAELNALNESQLMRYFSTTTVKFAILTNGETYKFYSDLEEKNIMDTVPFLSFNITKITDSQIAELKKFHKDNFDFDNILETAADLKYESELKKIIAREMEEPSEDFVRLLAKEVYSGICTKRIVEQFAILIKKVYAQLISDSVNNRLQLALNKENEKQKEAEEEIEEIPKIITTQEELSAFYIVKAILCEVVPIDKITYRDAQSYFSIFYDDNNRKQICRLYLNENKKQIGLIDSEKVETKIDIADISEIYKYSKNLKDTAIFYYEQEKNI